MSSSISSINGTNSLYYLSQMLRQSGSSSSSSTLTDVFGSLDEDGDGSISKSELETFLSDSSETLTNSVMGSPRDTGSLLGLFRDAAQLDSATGSTASTDQLFSKIDTSGDGSISEDELTTFASGLESGSTSATSSIDQLFSSIDADGDGSISEDEMESFASNVQSATSAPPPPPPPPADSTSSLDSLLESLGVTSSSDGTASTTSSTSTTTDQTESTNAFAAIIMEAIGKYMQFGQSFQTNTSALDVTG